MKFHYFGSSEIYAKGSDWYYSNFEDIDPHVVTGEASTSYLFDKVPYWYNKSNDIEYDTSLPALPALVSSELPRAKIIVVLRDPVRRAISAYFHWMKQGKLSPAAGLQRTALEHPRLRILQFGDYVRHLGAWMQEYPSNQLLVMLFEQDVVRDPDNGLKKVFNFLGLDPEFRPSQMRKQIYQSWSWTRIVASYYAGPFRRHEDAVDEPISRRLLFHDIMDNERHPRWPEQDNRLNDRAVTDHQRAVINPGGLKNFVVSAADHVHKNIRVAEFLADRRCDE